ncbi:MAG: ATP-binding cassette domain-containing protein [Synechococcales bacterium]|nr:ABC transporter ATP-binding protein [Cyanobacteria bacterium REEB444]MEB3124101.1 ATP-binding cassette domain-containing protein [Synechococcales bacterium]
MLLPSQPSTVPIASGNGAVSVRNLSKRYGNFTAIKAIDFDVEQGEIFGLIGPDGAGKTTCFHILGGIMDPTDGKVLVLGSHPRIARFNIGYLTQQFSLYLDLSVDENLRYSAGLRQVPEEQFRQRRDKYLRLMNLSRIGDRLAAQLSGGMKQKLALCCALVSQPQLLLLDEPTTGVDPVSRREFWDVLATLADDGMTIIVATPYLDEAERCNRIALLYEGQIKEIGTLSQLRINLGLQRLEVRTPALVKAEELLMETARGRPTIVDVQTFGDRLDVLVETAEWDGKAVRQAFHDNLVPIDSIQVSDATLENVFVTRLRQQGSDPVFLPFPRTKGSNSQGSPIDGKAIIAQNLQKTFGKFRAVKQVNLEIQYGEIYGLLGANGAGKTTTIKMLCGLLPATSGKMILAGQSHGLRSSTLRKRIGYMSQKFTLYDDLSILQNLEFYCGVYEVPPRLRHQKIAWVLETCGLIGRENMVTGKLPGGWKQRVSFGASVMHEPEILFLDEPTSGVDPLARRQFWRTINDFARQGTAILVTTHYLEEAEQCNRMGFMVAGEVVLQGSPGEVKAAQPGQLIELRVDLNQQAAHFLKTIVDPWRVSIFGDRLHVILDDPSVELPQIRMHLTKKNIHILSDRPIPFSLEDAFISTVQRSEAGNVHWSE